MSTPREPIYAALASQIRTQIENEILKPGDRLPSISEMCAQHGVTPTTITKVYSVLQQEKLIECERGRGSFVAIPHTKVLTHTIGIGGLTSQTALNPNAHPFSAGLMRGFIDSASALGKELLLLNGPPREWDHLDGVIVNSTAALDFVRRRPCRLPFVVTLYSVPDVVCVVAEERAGVQELMQHLLSLGHRRIAAILDPVFSPRRVSAYRDGLYDAGIEPNPLWIRALNSDHKPALGYPDLGFATMQQWLREDWRDLGCTAIVTQNDDTANGVIEALRQAKISVPEEVSVTGFDGTEIGCYLRPFLTTVEVPLHQIAGASIDLLQKQIAGEKIPPSTLSFPVSLKVGESTGPCCLLYK